MPRPREFDSAEAVRNAMDVFWRTGYAATSLQNLVDSTGVHRASLYGEFKDKKGLFLRCLAYYRQEVVPRRLEILEAPGGGMDAIRDYFAAVVGDLLGIAKGRGCLMVNSAVELAPFDDDVREQVGAHVDRLEQAFLVALREARNAGQIAKGARVKGLARFLASASQGLMVTGKAVPDRKRLEDIVSSTMAVLQSQD